MIYSMTGYAAQNFDTPNGQFAIELKSVNSRYLDIQLRLADDFRSIELALRELFTAQLSRGKIECRINFSPKKESKETPPINAQMLKNLRALDAEVRLRFPEAQALTVNEILRWNGVLEEPKPDNEQTLAEATNFVANVMGEFIESRAREGKKLGEIIVDRITKMREQITHAKQIIPEVEQHYEAKLVARMSEALGSKDDERIRQELAIFALKIDVAEEVARLTVHCDEVVNIVKKGGICGKKLDFLMQELNREANTLGSKSVSVELSKIAMELKLLIEQMREQIQNLE